MMRPSTEHKLTFLVAGRRRRGRTSLGRLALEDLDRLTRTHVGPDEIGVDDGHEDGKRCLFNGQRRRRDARVLSEGS